MREFLVLSAKRGRFAHIYCETLCGLVACVFYDASCDMFCGHLFWGEGGVDIPEGA